MKYQLLFFMVLCCWQTTLWGQRDDMPLLKERQDFAARSIQELKNNGAVVLRLKTNHRKLVIMERTLRSSKLTDAQRRRHQAIYEATIARRDAFNESLKGSFLNNFDFCPVYVLYDTSSKALASGVREGIFLNEKGAVDPNITLKEEHVFIASFKEKGADFPFDVLRVQRLEEKLVEPFPYYVAIRSSWVNEINAPRAAKAVVQLNQKFFIFLERALEYEVKKKEKAAKEAAKKSQS
ncbi:MAG: hypothetical protein AB8E82_18680 [Aureispira sp.]